MERVDPSEFPAARLAVGRREPVMVAESRAMREVRTLATRVAAGDAKILITGESGTGKDIVARFIHWKSHRASRPFIVVNCAALAETLLEAELFGHVKGAFTGAYRSKPGKLELANGGTIFLDEVGEMSPRMQALLLRFLENGEIQPVGSDATPRQIDARVIAATNRDPAALVAAGRFRQDLLYRIRVVRIHVPPLRQRPDDVRALVRMAIANSGRHMVFSEEVFQALEHYEWPGNIRQLQNLVEQLIWKTGREVITLHDLPALVRWPVEMGCPPELECQQVSDELFAGLVSGAYSFWDHAYPLFMARDITRHDLRETVKRGLIATCGSYRALVKLFGVREQDYKRFLNFLAAHECCVDFREFRTHLPSNLAASRSRDESDSLTS